MPATAIERRWKMRHKDEQVLLWRGLPLLFTVAGLQTSHKRLRFRPSDELDFESLALD